MIDLTDLLSQLRVPELPYASRFDKEPHCSSKGVEVSLLNISLSPNGEKQTILKQVQSEQITTKYEPQYINACYLSDRLFDTWLRKSSLDKAILSYLSKWRFAFAYLLIKLDYKLSAEPIRLFIDELLASFQAETLSWTPKPSNIAKPLLKQFEKIESVLFNPLISESEYMIELVNGWRAFLTNTNKRFHKVLNRLIDMEIGLSRSTWAESIAWQLIYKATHQGKFPLSLQQFLVDEWYIVLKSHLLGLDKSTNAMTLKDITQLTNMLIWVFEEKHKDQQQKIYTISADLIDSLIETAEAVNVQFQADNLAELEKTLLSLLRQEAITYLTPELLSGNKSKELVDFDSVELDKMRDIENHFIKSDPVKIYQYKDDPEYRFLIVGILSLTQQFLVVNHAGMKIFLIKKTQFDSECQTGIVKLLESNYTFERIIEDSLRGLDKVVSTQIKARDEAKQKARKEAESIVIAKRRAQKLAEKQDADRIKEIKKSKDEAIKKEKILQIKQVAELVDGLTLGAWVEFQFEDGVDAAMVKEKYKLAVKISTSQKFIFVDRFGLKRREILRKELVESILKDQARIVTHGENTSDTLERVVGRIRLGKV